MSIVWEIIIAIVVIALLAKLAWAAFCQLVFNPQISAVLTMIVWTIMLSTSVWPFTRVTLVAAAFVFADCIRDLYVGKKFYEFDYDTDLGLTIHKFLVVKGLLNLFTLGWVRIIYILFVYPTIASHAYKTAETDWSLGTPIFYPALQHSLKHSQTTQEAYYYDKYTHGLIEDNLLEPLSEVVEYETGKFSQKYSDNDPKHWIESIARFFGQDKEREAKQEELMKRRNDTQYYRDTYVNPAVLASVGHAVLDEISSCNVNGDPYDISSKWTCLKEFRACKRVTPTWGELVVIRALQPYVASSAVMDTDANDGPHNHVYGTVPRVENPALHDDDLED